jgi:hypothetical protein
MSWKENINQKSKYPVGRTLVHEGFESRGTLDSGNL